MKLRILCLFMVLLCLLTGGAQADPFFIFTDYTDEEGTEATEGTDADGNLPGLYVAEYGDDANPGTFDLPVQTLLGALRHVVEEGGTDPVTIWLRGGTYYIRETLQIGGIAGRMISIAAYPGEEPVITGAAAVTNWVETSYMNTAIWSATVDATDIRALYGSDGARPISRWPKEGMLTVSKSIEETKDKFTSQGAFYADTGEAPAALGGATVRLLHWWKDELSAVRSYDPITGLVTMNRQSAMAIAEGDRYWFENVLSISLAEGEWAFDASTRTLYYMPREGETPENTLLYAGTTEQLIRVSGMSGITFDGVTFARTGWSIPNYDASPDFPQAAYDVQAVIHVYDSRNVRFANCTFRDIGAGCIRLEEKVKSASVTNCVFEEIGAQAVYVHGVNQPYEEQQTGAIVVENNVVSGFGRNFYNAAAMLVVHARDIDISHNEIHDGAYTAISAGWVWGEGYNVTDEVRIRNNLIYNIGQSMLSDMGAIYMLGEQQNSIITGNVIHDVRAAEYGGWGIYLDEGSSGIAVTNNLVYRCSAQGFHQHNGVYNTVQNNIFAFNQEGQIGGSGKGAFLLERNLIVGGKPYLNRPDTVHITTRDNVYSETDEYFINVSEDNYNLTDNPAIYEKGFIAWVYNAGRYILSTQ